MTKLEVANAKIAAFQAVGCSAYLEGWKNGNGCVQIVHDGQQAEIAQASWRASESLKEILRMDNADWTGAPPPESASPPRPDMLG